jgi:hypothetical protein
MRIIEIKIASHGKSEINSIFSIPTNHLQLAMEGYKTVVAFTKGIEK